MTDLTAVDIMIQPDAIAIAREVNRRMPLSIPAGITLDDTHLPHITMLQRHLITADLDRAYAAIESTIAATDVANLSYRVPGSTHSEHWDPAVTPFTGTGGTDAAFVTDPGQQISATTKDWVETYQPNQVGANYTAHLTVGLARVADLKATQAEPFDEFDGQPVGLAVNQLGNNGTARTLSARHHAVTILIVDVPHGIAQRDDRSEVSNTFIRCATRPLPTGTEGYRHKTSMRTGSAWS